MNWLMNTETKKLKVYKLLFELLSITFLAVIPAIIVATKYKIFTNDATKLNGWVIIFAIIILVPTVKYLSRLVDNMPDVKICGKHKGDLNTTKIIIKTIRRLIIPVSLYIVMLLFRADVSLAFNTFIWVVSSMLVAMLIEELCLSPIRFIIKLDTDNAIQDAKDARRALNTK